jgi:hypothetical protein
MTRHVPPHRRALAGRIATGAIVAALATAPLGAQERLLDLWGATSGAVVENWSLPTAAEVATSSGQPMYIRGVTQLTIPFTGAMALSSDWSADVYAAYAWSRIRLARPNAEGATSLSLSGNTDARVRVVGHLAHDLVTVTFGLTAPTGRTALTSSELDALSVLAAPSLQFRTPGLGTGAAATAGAVMTRQIGTWSGVIGGSYEYRGSYSPTAALEAGLITGDLRPGNMMHFTIGGAYVAGAFRHSVNVSTDVTSDGALHLSAAGLDAHVNLPLATRPSFTAMYEMDAVRPRVQTSVFVLARQHGKMLAAGNVYPGTDRTELDGGTQSVFALAPGRALRWEVDGRHQSHSADGHAGAAAGAPSGFATSGVDAVGSTLALRFGSMTHAWSAEPFVRGQIGRLDFGERTLRSTGSSAGLTISTRF